MVTYQEYRAAVERLRRVASESASGVYADVFVDSDKLTIYDAEHDQTPASVEWLESIEIAFKLLPGFELKCAFVGSIEIWDYESELLAKTIGWHKVNPTRGDVLTALRLFKKEGAA